MDDRKPLVVKVFVEGPLVDDAQDVCPYCNVFMVRTVFKHFIGYVCECDNDPWVEMEEFIESVPGDDSLVRDEYLVTQPNRY